MNKINLFDLYAKIKLDTKDYERAIKDANKDGKSLSERFKSMATNSETLKNKVKVLAGEYQQAKNRVAVLTEAFNQSAKSTGVNSEETRKLAKELKEAEAEASSLKNELDGYSKNDGLSKWADRGKKALSTMAKVGAAGLAAAGTAIVAVTKQAVEAYADYEQLVGGVETLFKDSADTVMDYAANAYKTAGLSANQYMETVTSFSASLMQSLGGDSELAAEYSDRAVRDMADNANKMGTSMDSIMLTYQSLARGNFAMLDNLNTMGALAA